jgi:biopolymer transport protein ExbD
MAFSYSQRSGHSAISSEINMIPLIDVMLVLLVIFMVTAPLLTHAVKLNLPVAESQVSRPQSKPLSVSVQADGSLFLFNQKIERERLKAEFQQAVGQDPTIELHLRADTTVAYGRVAEVMSDASAAGISRMGFITQP